MAKILKGSCPSCLNNNCDLIFFKYGSVTSTMCPYCLVRYLKTSVIPTLDKNNNAHDDNLISEVFSNDTTE